jgi:hypothetical protein
MKNLNYLFLALFFLGSGVFFSACNHETAYRKDLLSVEKIIEKHPDSAAVLLSRIPAKGLNEGDAALYRILKTQTLYHKYPAFKGDTNWTQPIDYFEKMSDEQHLAKCYYLQGLAYQSCGDLCTALKNQLKANTLIEQTKDSTAIMRSNFEIADILANQDMGDDAHPYYKKAYRYANAIHHYEGMVVALCNETYYYEDRLQYDSCLSLYLKAMKIAREHKINTQMRYVYIGVAGAYDEMKDYDKALYYSKLCLADNDKPIDDNYYNAHAIIGECYLKKSEYDLAEKHLLIASQCSFPESRVHAFENLFTLEAKRGRVKEAVAYRDSSDQTLQRYFHGLKSNTLKDIHTQYEKKLKRQSDHIVRLQYKVSLLCLGCLVLLLTIALLVVWQIVRRNRRRMKREKQWFESFSYKQTQKLAQLTRQYEDNQRVIEKLTAEQTSDAADEQQIEQLKTESIEVAEVITNSRRILTALFSDKYTEDIELLQHICREPRHGQLAAAEWEQVYSLIEMVDPIYYEKVKSADLTEQVKQILYLIRLGIPRRVLAEIFSKEPNSINKIAQRGRQKAGVL